MLPIRFTACIQFLKKYSFKIGKENNEKIFHGFIGEFRHVFDYGNDLEHRRPEAYFRNLPGFSAAL